MQVGATGQEVPVVLDDDDTGDPTAYDLSSLCAHIDGAFLLSEGIKRTRDALDRGELPRLDIDGRRRGCPIARPGAVVCIGMNYAAHAAESGAATPARPVMFLKTPNTVGGPDDPVRIPTGSLRTDWEVELGVVIGRPAYELDSPEEAQGCVAGYLVANDLSERAWQLEESGGQWSKGKCAPGFTPLGPYLVPSGEVDPGDLRLRSWVNGQLRQDASTTDLIFPVPYVVHHLSQYLALEPGDLVLTGTPAGVALSGRFPYLRTGDRVEAEIVGLGRQRQQMVS